jgi:hypothetical protein
VTLFGKTVDLGKTVKWTAAISGVAGFAYSVDPNILVQHMSMVAQSQIAQAGFFFTLAAWLHAGRVKKEINDSFSTLITSLDNLGDALRKELKIHADQLASHRLMLDKLGEEVSKWGSVTQENKQGDKI